MSDVGIRARARPRPIPTGLVTSSTETYREKKENTADQIILKADQLKSYSTNSTKPTTNLAGRQQQPRQLISTMVNAQYIRTTLLLLLGSTSVNGFAPPISAIRSSSTSSFVIGDRIPGTVAPTPIRPLKGSSTLKCALLPNVVTKISPPVRNAILFGTAAVAVYKNRRKFYPGSEPDSSFSEPLPEGRLGCPFVGNLGVIFNSGDNESGPGKFFRKQAASVGDANRKIFKYMFFGKPTIMLSGMKNIKEAFNTEFKRIKTGVALKSFSNLFGAENLLFVQDPDRHQYMRRLLGQSMTPEAISNSIPALVTGATKQIDTLKSNPTSEMEQVLTSFTLDVAWRQILGLGLEEDEIETFYKATEDWIGGIVDLKVILLPGYEKTKSGKARKYLVEKIERKIDDLEKNGPDGSTMSYMVYARDEEDETKRLTRQEIIDNALLLILAGSETAASTLTVSMLALGLNKDAFQKLKDEQADLISRKGEELTRPILDKECPYLEAVIKETMRLKPIAGTGALRFAQETFTIDGKQIPKGYGVAFK
jgi:cytochrome P450